MEHFEVDITLHPNLVDLLWSTHRQRIDDYHKHTVGEDYTNLDILILDSNEALDTLANKFPVRPTRMSLMYVAPNAVIVPHVDGKDYGRNTAVVFPLVQVGKCFAPTTLYKVENDSHSHLDYDNAYAFSTQVMHGVENNENERLALQLWFEEDCDTLKNLMDLNISR